MNIFKDISQLDLVRSQPPFAINYWQTTGSGIGRTDSAVSGLDAIPRNSESTGATIGRANEAAPSIGRPAE